MTATGNTEVRQDLPFMSWFIACIRCTTLIPPLVLLFRLCEECSQQTRVGPYRETMLASAGLIVGIGALLTRRDIRDTLVILVTFGGGVLLTISALANHRPCGWCLAFWLLWMCQFIEVCMSGRRMSLLARISAITVSGCSALTMTSVETRGMINSLLEDRMPVRQGLLPGTSMPYSHQIPKTCIAILAASCPKCWSVSMKTAIREMQEKRQHVTVIVRSGAAPPDWAPKEITVYEPDSFFKACNVRPEGLPVFISLKGGIVKSSYDVSEVRK